MKRSPSSATAFAVVAAIAAADGIFGCAAFQTTRSDAPSPLCRPFFTRARGLKCQNVAVRRRSATLGAASGLDIADGIDAGDAILVPPALDQIAAATSAPADVSLGNSPLTDTVVFVIGLIPFLWATVEFWRRIAVGESFGTGADSVVIIGEEGKPQSSRGRRVLGKGALAAAYVLFGVAALSVSVAVYSVVTSPGMADAGAQSAVDFAATASGAS
uniref:Uncharacterized protein n=1 Tax=Odontella aurita TaxID=265563 RepID=A0A7S4JVK2_9STRA|mmetsp:Transcript_54445/g.162730  ORF Transcript_54445/g.162730 Transcript_54445/m.162730 type:complete len:216 (+) Transcript_54445:232-879(+)